MNKKFIVAIVAILITGFLVVPSMAKGPKWEAGEKGPSKQAGKSNIGHLYLYEKAPDPELTRDDPWLIVEGGMWGKMKYNLSGPTFKFVFNGHKLPIGQSYTLIYYPDPWVDGIGPVGLICLGSGIVTEDEEETNEGGGGNIHIKDSVDTGSFPIESDDNYSDGAKIFLVPSECVTCLDEGSVMNYWPEDDANLYEGALIRYVDTDER